MNEPLLARDNEQSMSFLQGGLDEEDGNNDEKMRLTAGISMRNQWTNGGAIDFDQEDRAMSFDKVEEASGRTLSRMIVEKYLKNFEWYNPRKDDPTAPIISRGWHYFEHVTLARRLSNLQGTENEGSTLERAEPGETEKETELFSPWTTPESALSEWGIGVAVYFATLRIMAVMFLVAGLISIPNIVFFKSKGYSGKRAENALFFTLEGTAICTRFLWVACEDCLEKEWDGNEERKSKFGWWKDPNSSESIAFVQRNDCRGADFKQGIVNWSCLIFLIICTALLNWYQVKREIRFNEDKTTSSDYSVKVSNPPPDAIDCQEWKDFFEQYSEKQVTVVTIALDNEQLLQALVNRRIFRSKLRFLLPGKVDMDDPSDLQHHINKHIEERDATPISCLGLLWRCTVVPILRIFNMALPAEVLQEKIEHFTLLAEELVTKPYSVTDVFITFETEEGQRAALDGLRSGNLRIWRNREDYTETTPTFQGRVLKVAPPTEPSAVRWLDLRVSTPKKVCQRILTFSITVGMIAISGFIIAAARRDFGPVLFGVILAVINFLVPNLCKLLLLLEKHKTEGGRQTSLYLKITLFRWVNTAILPKLITPFTSTLGNGSRDLLRSINAVLWAEMLLSPTLRLLDIVGNVRKHILAPRARTQHEMLRNFTGTPYNLAERYTDFTKVVLLCYFYSALNPNAFFMGFGTLILQYYVDKYCLMRVWAIAPLIGTRLAVFSRRHFFSSALVIMAVVSSYAWAQFPYDNICDPVNVGDGGFAGTYQNVQFLNGTNSDLVVTQDNPVVFCNQQLLKLSNFNFPALPVWQSKDKKWMSESQERTSRLYGWTSLIIVISFLIGSFGKQVLETIMSLIGGSHGPNSKDQKIDFSAIRDNMLGYVPQIKVGGFVYPCLACDIDDIDEQLIGWKDPFRTYDHHNLIFDIPHSGLKRKRKSKVGSGNVEGTTDRSSAGLESPSTSSSSAPIFSIVRHWPPEWAKKND